MSISMARGRQVKNLGWLLRNWKSVDHFIVTKGDQGASDVYLIAKLRDGDTYETDFADRTVLFHWLNRPVFRGAKVKWFGHDMTIGSGQAWKDLRLVFERGYHLAGRHERGENPFVAGPKDLYGREKAFKQARANAATFGTIYVVWRDTNGNWRADRASNAPKDTSGWVATVASSGYTNYEYEKARRHEGGRNPLTLSDQNPRVSAPLKKRISALVGGRKKRKS